MKLSASSEKAPLVAPENLAPFILVTVLFFLWGVPNILSFGEKSSAFKAH